MDNQPETSTALKYVVPFVTAAFGAFFGALSAFWLGSVKQKRDESNRRHTALLAAQYALFSQWNIVEDIRRNLLEPSRKDPNRHLNLRVFIRAQAPLTVPFKELTFIIDSDEPNLLQEIHLAEQGYIGAIDTLERWNAIRGDFYSKYQPETIDMATGRASVTVQSKDIFLLKNAADILYDQVDKALPKFDEQIKKVFKYVKRNFKGKKAINAIQPIEAQPVPTPNDKG